MRWSLDRRWVALLLTAVVTGLTFWPMWSWSRSRASDIVRIAQNEVISPESQTPPVSLGGNGRTKKSVAQVGLERVNASGKWFSWLYWQPLRFTSVNQWTDLPGTLLGMGIMAALLVSIVRGIWLRQWLWPALAVYCGAMIAGWANPVARYLVPLLPFLTLAILDTIVWLAPPRCGPLRRITRSLLYMGFVVSVVVCNLALWSVDVWVAHSSDFYAHYEAGMNNDLVAAARYLRENTSPQQCIAVSTRYENLAHSGRSFFGPRAMVLLADRPVCRVPLNKSTEPGADNKRLVSFCRNSNAEFYLYQPPVNPWRLWHFRVPPWVQTRMAQHSEDDEADIAAAQQGPPSADWQLWKLFPGAQTRISLDACQDRPRRVPGL
jgi:hypothetical protein